MSRTSPPTFACPECGKRFSWKDEFAGKKMACVCGKSFEVTRGLEGAAMGGDVFDLATGPGPSRTTRVVRKMPAAVPRKMEDAWKREISPVRDRLAPAVLIALGMAGRAAQLIFAPVKDRSQAVESLVILLEIIVNVGMVFLGAYFVALVLGLDFGDLLSAALKLTGMAIFAGAVAIWAVKLDRMPLSVRGLVIGLHLVVLIYFVVLSAFFEMDLQEALIATVMIGALQGLMMVGLHAMG